MGTSKIFFMLGVFTFALPLILCIGLAPLFQTANTPARSRDSLRVAVCDFDGGRVGRSLVTALQAIYASGALMPNFEIVDSSGTSTRQLVEAVRDSTYFAAIWVPAGTSSALESALVAPGSPAAAAYTPALAVQWVWDEGRNPSITSARVGAPLRSILGKFAAQFAAQQLATHVAAGTNVTYLAVSQPRLLSTPVDVTETIVYPAASTVSIGGLATTIGLILIAVFSMAGTSIVLGLPLQLSGFSILHSVLVQCAGIFAFGCTISISYATLVVGMAGLSGTQWAQLWAVMWLLYLVIAYFLLAVGLIFSPKIITLPFFFVLVFNIIGGWNIELADPGYVFFMYTPFYHASHLLRNILFGSWRSKIDEACGILFLWLGIDILFCFAACVILYRKSAATARAASKEPHSGPETGVAALPANPLEASPVPNMRGNEVAEV